MLRRAVFSGYARRCAEKLCLPVKYFKCHWGCASERAAEPQFCVTSVNTTYFKVKTMTGSATRTIQQTKSSTILQRIENKDRTAVRDCIEAYGNFIWALAKKFTASTEEAEAATLEIFQDIWRYSERGDKRQSAEDMVISQIARRRLIRYLQWSRIRSNGSRYM